MKVKLIEILDSGYMVMTRNQFNLQNSSAMKEDAIEYLSGEYVITDIFDNEGAIFTGSDLEVLVNMAWENKDG